jgi:hypothetical protein
MAEPVGKYPQAYPHFTAQQVAQWICRQAASAFREKNSVDAEKQQ